MDLKHVTLYMFMGLQTEKKQSNTELTHGYVKEYYNKYLSKLSEEYTDSRWFSSVASRFDHHQTHRALQRSLGSYMYDRGLEVGPGDGAWTSLVLEHIKNELHLFDQSKEMIARAQKRLAHYDNVTYEIGDFLSSDIKSTNNLVVSVRCFEYFTDKKLAAEKLYDAVAPGGRLILITKNPEFVSTTPKVQRPLHVAQSSLKNVREVLEDAGFIVEHIYPATMRWRAKNVVMRFVFDILHRLAVLGRSNNFVPFISRYASESYLYSAIKK